MKFFKRDKTETVNRVTQATSVKQTGIEKQSPLRGQRSLLKYNVGDFQNGSFRYQLYKFLVDTIPAVNACLDTWVRLSAAPGEYVTKSERGQRILDELTLSMYKNALGKRGSMVSFLSELYTSLFRDGLFSGFLTVKEDGSGIDQFIPVNASDIYKSDSGKFYIEFDNKRLNLDRNDFYLIPHNADSSYPIGKSILQSVSFVSYIEQQLIDDMRRTSHNSGYHRLHVKITPPDRLSGESDKSYVDRINSYFDSTVDMIKSCDIDENPVTWDNVHIEHVGPENVKAVTNSWFMNHRAMIEEICAGTNLAPFLLGYSFGATSTWASFKFDIVMRQIKSIQAEVASFLEWIGNIELAMHGVDEKCRYQFDNTFAYQASDESQIKSSGVDNILKLYQAGLIDEDTARIKSIELI
ncbi:MAG: hypothetical protein DWP97_06070 [Calditrichaeota bacterium]|nr:MAG: hypothetical protein DWP97_06070 [Calditrichota bacterium]